MVNPERERVRLGGKEEGVGMSKGRQGKGVDREEVQREKQKSKMGKTDKCSRCQLVLSTLQS